jgi:hypothetical protein
MSKDYESARQFYEDNKHKIKPFEYKICNSRLVYSSVLDKKSGISKGTCFRDYVFPNLYRCDQYSNNKHIVTYRCGITPNSTANDFKKLTNSKKPFIIISLLGACTTAVCDLVKTIGYTGLLPKSAYNSLIEDKTIELEKRLNYILPLFIPIRSQIIQLAGPLHITLSYTNPETTRKNIDHTIMKKMISVKDAASEFKSIVDISEYYYNRKDKYTFLVHCRSGKDRTNITHAIILATNDCLMTHGFIDYTLIRKNSWKFVEPGLIIAFFSTGIYGLKIKQLELAHYIMTDKQVKEVAR